ncbi:PREDICTED: uncharacterized protein LOC108558375 [Nicrophorus vespilloides]|uniref:Uncharacterized protein LOC108558375 n=1 Tax=Nicrophorus vespilloides TaxID=110193 RepID=A0ABM1M861_NICVS|nr:PREDICTED: uncharacterized protein LOC108558375 [Nicrophorus vespilloides]
MLKIQVLWFCAFLAHAYSKDLSVAFRATLVNEIQPNFAENLRRAFNNEGIRQQNMQKVKYLLFSNTAHSRNSCYMSHKKIQMFPVPEFRVNEFKVDLAEAVIHMNLNLGNSTIVTDMEIVNDTMFNGMYNVSNNNLKIDFIGLSASVVVGFAPDEDSFVPKNYNLQVIPDEIKINLLENNVGTPQIVKFLANDYSPATIFKSQLNEKIRGMLHWQLGSVLVEYSVNELLLDEDDEIREYKDYLRKRVLKANSIIDNLVNTAKSRKFLKDIEFPTDFMLPYKQEKASVMSKLTGKGIIKDVANLTRLHDWSLLETNKSIMAFGSLSIKDYKFVYDYKTEYMNSKIQGKISATIYKNQLNVEMLTLKDTCQTRVEILSTELSDIEIDISGLGGLSWLQPNIRDIVIGTIHVDTLYKVERHLEKQLTAAQKGSSCITL